MAASATFDFSNLRYVDDRSPFIIYSGSWSLVSNNGSYNATVHSTTEIGASASLWFQGSYIFIALTLPACPSAQSHLGTRLQYYLSGIDENGRTGTICSQAGVINGFQAYRMPVSGDPNVFHEVRVTNMGSDPLYPLMFDSFAFLPSGTQSTLAPFTTTFGTTPFPVLGHTASSTTTLASTTLPILATIAYSSVQSSPIQSTSTPDANTDSQAPLSPLTRIILGSCMSLAAIFLVGGVAICCLRRRARSKTSKTFRETPDDPFDDAYGKLAPPVIRSMVHPHFFQQHASSSSSTQLVQPLRADPVAIENRNPPNGTRPSFRPRSQNSLFDVSMSPTPSRQCILGQKSEFNRCFCPSCDDRTANAPRRKYRWSSAMRSIVPSIASSNATAAPAYARYRASIDVRSVQSSSFPVSEVPPAYDGLHSIDETSSLTSPSSWTPPVSEISSHSYVASPFSLSESSSTSDDFPTASQDSYNQINGH